MSLVPQILGFFGEYRFLSNFWYVDVQLDGIIYPTVEHAYQAAKTFDVEQRELIRLARSPSDAKKMGKAVTLRPDWEYVKVLNMTDLIRQKFAPGSKYAEMLIATGDAYLEETNYWNDTFWGVYNGRGKNVLGNILMNIRTELTS